MKDTILVSVANHLLNSRWPLKVRVLGCVVKQCAATGSELAAFEQPKRYDWDRRRFIPLTNTTIAEMMCAAEVAERLSAGDRPNEEERADMMPHRQNIRRALSEMDEAGIITRVRIEDRQATDQLLPLAEAIRERLVTPLRSMSPEEALGANDTAIYLNLQTDSAAGIAPEGVTTPEVQPEGR